MFFVDWPTNKRFLEEMLINQKSLYKNNQTFILQSSREINVSIYDIQLWLF